MVRGAGAPGGPGDSLVVSIAMNGAWTARAGAVIDLTPVWRAAWSTAVRLAVGLLDGGRRGGERKCGRPRRPRTTMGFHRVTSALLRSDFAQSTARRHAERRSPRTVSSLATEEPSLYRAAGRR